MLVFELHSPISLLFFFSFPPPFSITAKTNSNHGQLEHYRSDTEMATDCE